MDLANGWMNLQFSHEPMHTFVLVQICLAEMDLMVLRYNGMHNAET